MVPWPSCGLGPSFGVRTVEFGSGLRSLDFRALRVGGSLHFRRGPRYSEGAHILINCMHRYDTHSFAWVSSVGFTSTSRPPGDSC